MDHPELATIFGDNHEASVGGVNLDQDRGDVIVRQLETQPLFHAPLTLLLRALDRYIPQGILADLGAGTGTIRALYPSRERTILEVDNQGYFFAVKFILPIQVDGVQKRVEFRTARETFAPALIDDANTLSRIPDNTMAGVTSLNLLTVTSPQALAHITHSTARVLTPGGIAAHILTLPHSSDSTREYLTHLNTSGKAIIVNPLLLNCQNNSRTGNVLITETKEIDDTFSPHFLVLTQKGWQHFFRWADANIETVLKKAGLDDTAILYTLIFFNELKLYPYLAPADLQLDPRTQAVIRGYLSILLNVWKRQTPNSDDMIEYYGGIDETMAAIIKREADIMGLAFQDTTLATTSSLAAILTQADAIRLVDTETNGIVSGNSAFSPDTHQIFSSLPALLRQFRDITLVINGTDYYLKVPPRKGLQRLVSIWAPSSQIPCYRRVEQVEVETHAKVYLLAKPEPGSVRNSQEVLDAISSEAKGERRGKGGGRGKSRNKSRRKHRK